MGGGVAGKRIGAYELLSKIGSGGMGAVYKARQDVLDRIVALKLLPPDLAKNTEYTQRFVREARAAGKLSHPNIVAGIDVGEADGYHYFAMEFVEGETVADIQSREGKVPEDRAMLIATQVAEGLAHAHENGLIHRDIKPANILIESTGVAKVCDLGLARSMAGDEASLTQTGAAVGTPFYTSPEQASGEKDLDARTDVYSLGATLYHIVAGDPPFNGPTPAVIMTKHLTEPVPELAKSMPGVSEGLSGIVSKCMAKDRKARYASMAALIEDLGRVREGKSPTHGRALPRVARGARERSSTAPSRSARQPASERPAASSTMPLVVGAVAVLVLGGLALTMFSGKSTTAPGKKKSPKDTARTESTNQGNTAKSNEALEGELDQAVSHWRSHPQDYSGALTRLRKLLAGAKGTEYEKTVQEKIEEITRRRDAAAAAAQKRLSEEAAPLAAAGNYDAAIGVWQKLPPALADVLQSPADTAIAELRTKAESRLQAAMDQAQTLSATAPEKAIAALDGVKSIKYSAWDARIATLGTRILDKKKMALAAAEQQARALAKKKLAGLIDAFVAATLKGDLSGAIELAGRARKDASLKSASAELTALTDLADALSRADAARRKKLESLKNGKKLAFKTKEGMVRGQVVAVETDRLELKCESRINQKTLAYKKTIRLMDLAPDERKRLEGEFEPKTDAEQLALAIRYLLAEDWDVAAKHLALAKDHALAPPYQARMVKHAAEAAEAMARQAWKSILKDAGTGKLTTEKARKLEKEIAAFEQAHGKSRYASTIKSDLAALKERVLQAGAGWRVMPINTLATRHHGRATSSIAGEKLVVSVPPGKNHSIIPLLTHARDFRLKFEYEGHLLEMFLRKVNWHGCLNVIAAKDTIVVRAYPTDNPNNQQDLARKKQANVLPPGWHTVDILARGRSITIKIDNKIVCHKGNTPAVARGASYIMAWPKGNTTGSFKIRNVAAVVLDKDPKGGTIEGILMKKAPDSMDIKRDGEDVANRYVPMQMADGTFDPKVIKVIQARSLVTLNRVRATWRLDGRVLRLLGVQPLIPEQRSGTLVGVITFKHRACIEVTPPAGPPERLIPRWIGGMPAQGGGPEKRMIAKLRHFSVGDRVKVHWAYDQRKRLVGIEPAK